MFAIIITLCASAAMDDCQVYSLGTVETMASAKPLPAFTATF